MEERIRLLDAAVLELRGAVQEEPSTESVEAHHRSTLELARLRAVLRDARAVEDVPDDPHIVELGDTVAIELDSGELESYIVVHAAEAPVEDRRISVESPLGAALLGRRVGDQVEVRAPGGSYWCTILSAQRSDLAPERRQAGATMLTVSRDGKQVVVGVHAPVDGPSLQLALTDLVDGQGIHLLRVVVDDADFVDLVGVAAVIRAASRLAARGGSLDVRGCAPELEVAVALICTGSDCSGIGWVDLDDAVRQVHRLALGLRTVGGAPDGLVVAGEAIGVLDDLLRRLRERAIRIVVPQVQ